MRGTGVYDDLEAEQDQLDDVLGRLGQDDWGRPSAAVGWLAARTLPYAFEVAGRNAGPVRCELTGPGGERWEFGAADAGSRISGAAGAFCRVAARRLAAEDSGLTATGPDAAAALLVVRTYV